MKLSALLFVACTLVLASLAPASVAAGTLGEFRDSVDRDNAPRRSGSRGSRGDSNAGDDGDCSDSPVDGVLGRFFGLILTGDVPGPAFSWGATPYDDRGFVLEPKVASADANLSVFGSADRPGHFRGRLDGLMLSDASAGGFGVFALVESTHSPGVAVWHQQYMDFGASDRLGVTALTLEPRIATLPGATFSWNVGGVMYGSENGVVNAGMQLGLGLQLTPLRPLAFEGRFAVHVMSGLAVADVLLSGGIEVAPGIFTTLGYRGLIGPELPLHAGIVGLQIDLGFGGNRRRRAAQTAW